MAVRLTAAYCAPVLRLNLQAARPAEPVSQPQTEVRSRKSEFRTAECRTSTRSNDWFTSTFYILHSTFYIRFTRALRGERLFYFCLFPFYFCLPRRGFCRCYPLLFRKIKAKKTNEITLLGDWKSEFPCINSDYSENPSPSIRV